MIQPPRSNLYDPSSIVHSPLAFVRVMSFILDHGMACHTLYYCRPRTRLLLSQLSPLPILNLVLPSIVFPLMPGRT